MQGGAAIFDGYPVRCDPYLPRASQRRTVRDDGYPGRAHPRQVRAHPSSGWVPGRLAFFTSRVSPPSSLAGYRAAGESDRQELVVVERPMVGDPRALAPHQNLAQLLG